MAFASSKKAIAECDICGFRFKLRELRNIITRGRDTNIKACPQCFSPDHPQNKQGLYPVRDPQAIRDPRPDFAGYEQSRNYAWGCLLYTSPSPRDSRRSRMPSSA